MPSYVTIMSISHLFRTDSNSYAESTGFYEQIPIRVGEFVLTKNEKGLLEFKSSSQEICGNGPMTVIRVSNSESGWSVMERQGPYQTEIVPAVDFSKERLARRRAFWHAAQYMSGRDLSFRERFNRRHQVTNDDADVFDDDAFFKDGNAITTVPFEDFVE